MNPQAMEPFASALHDYLQSDTEIIVVFQRDDGLRGDLPIRWFFRASSEFSPIERTALELCRGAVLDAGAGAGCHSLALQDRGLPVCAIDICPQIVEIMHRRGVKDAHCADVMAFNADPFDTILFMGCSIGNVETLSGLDHFLARAHKLLKAGGQILFDCLDVRCTDAPVQRAYQEANRRAGRYIGETRGQLEYKGTKAPSFGLLHVDPETAESHASRTGWSCHIACEEEGGRYLMQLTQPL